jgi:RNA polymerase sigma factor (sigma-70 family)
MEYAVNMEPLTNEQKELAEKYIGFVYKFVSTMFKGGGKIDPQRFDDIVQAGFFGLMRATQKFDAEKGFTFSTYAANWIKSYAMIEYHTKGPIRLGRGINSKITKINNSRHPSESFLSALNRSDYPESTKESILSAVKSRKMVCIDERYESSLSAAEVIPDKSVLDPMIGCKITELKEALESLPSVRGKRTPSNIKSIVFKRCFLKEHTLGEIGNDYGITRERVRQLRDEALEFVRQG